MKFCPRCKRLVEYDPCSDRYRCTSCDWRSDKVHNYVPHNRNFAKKLVCHTSVSATIE